MRSHIVIHPATTISSAKPFIFKIAIEREGLPRDSPAGSGAGGPRFESGRPTKNISRVFFYLLKAQFTPKPICGILAGRRSQFTMDSS